MNHQAAGFFLLLFLYFESTSAVFGAVGRIRASTSPAFTVLAENLPALVALVKLVLTHAAFVADGVTHGLSSFPTE